MSRTQPRGVAVPAQSAPPAVQPARLLPQLRVSDAALSALKWLALALMVLDHSNKYLLADAYPWMYSLGRVSMPLFAVVLGYNLGRPGVLERGVYARVATKLAAGALLATVPMVALNHLPWGWWPLNMMATLLVVTVCAWLFDLRRTWTRIAAVLVLLIGGAVVEYWWPALGLSLCVLGYRRRPSLAYVIGFLACLALLYFVNGNFWAFACIPVMAVLLQWKLLLPRARDFFYVFYPLHLALIWLILKVSG